MSLRDTLPFLFTQQHVDDPPEVAHFGLSGRTVKLHRDCTPEFCGNLRLGVWRRSRGVYKMAQIQPSSAGGGRRLWFRKGARRQEIYRLTGDFLELDYESGQVGAGEDDWRKFSGYRWLPAAVTRWGSPGAEWFIEEEQQEFEGADATVPVRQSSQRLYCTLYGAYTISNQRGRERFFTALQGYPLADEVPLGGHEVAAARDQQLIDDLLSLRVQAERPRRALRVLRLVQFWGFYPGDSQIDTERPWTTCPNSEVYFYAHLRGFGGLGLVGWEKWLGKDRAPHRLMRRTVLDTLVREVPGQRLMPTMWPALL